MGAGTVVGGDSVVFDPPLPPERAPALALVLETAPLADEPPVTGVTEVPALPDAPAPPDVVVGVAVL